MSQVKKEFIEMIRERSYQKREVTLVSGRKSDFYIDMKNTLLHPQGIALASELIFDHVQELNKQGMNIKAIGGPTMGADPIATGVSFHSHLQKSPLLAFYVRKEPKKHGTEAWVEGIGNLNQGDQVILLEDVVTTGGSTIKCVEKVKAAGLDIKAIVSTVDRQEGAAENIASTGIPFFALVTKADIVGGQ